MSTQFEVAGLSDLLKQFDEFTDKIERNALRGALRAGAREIANEVKARVPIKTGALRDSVGISTNARKGIITATIKAGGRVKGGSNKGKTGSDRGAFYAHMVEFGTAAHLIRVAQAVALSIGGGFAKIVHHPGAQPHPFFRPAIASKTQAAIDAVPKYLAKRLDKLNEPDNES